MHQVTALIDWSVAALAALSFLLSGLIFLIRKRVPRLSGRIHDLQAVQAMHTRPTPRVGGIAIFITLGLSLIVSPAGHASPSAEVILAASLLFAVGLLEDLGISVSPRQRLIAAAGASLVVIVMLGVWIPRAGIPGLDALVQYPVIGVPLTLLITAGIANGFNLIDGVNGLASMTAIAAAVCLGLIAQQSGYADIVPLAIMLAAGVFGFFLINYPFGLVFLGDAGAYTVGFVLSWIGIAVLLNAPEVSAWAILLTVFWPVADTLLAIYRRMRRSAAAMAPDRLHVHQMVMRALEICALGRKRRRFANPLSTLFLAPFVVAPPIIGVAFWNQPLIAFGATMAFSALFFTSYVLAPVIIRRYRRKPWPQHLARKAA